MSDEEKIASDRKLQEERLAFERDKAAYEQNAQHLRALNTFLWQVPTIAITLTGGLWYGVTTIESSLVKWGLLYFACFADFLLILVLARVRFLFGQYLAVQIQFNPKFNIASEVGPLVLPKWTVVGCFSLLLAIGAAGSFYGATHVDRISPAPMKAGNC